MNPMEEKEIALKSEQLNDMLASPPAGITRSGNGILLGVIGLVLFLTWFIHYPDEVSGNVLVSSSQAPIALSNQSYVQLKTLHVTENQLVKQGDLLAQFDSPIRSGDLRKTTDYLNRLEAYHSRFPDQLPLPEEQPVLGPFQEQWTNLLSGIRKWNAEHAFHIEVAETRFIRQEIAFREELNRISGKKIRLAEGDYALAAEQLASSDRLAERNAISRQEATQDRHFLRQVLQSVQAQKEQYFQHLIAHKHRRKEKLRLEHDAEMEKLQQIAGMQHLINSLSNALRNWEKQAVWTAPCSGKVVFNKLLQVNRYYKPDEASLVIVPIKGRYRAIASISETGAGKLKPGQTAFIELNDYPKTAFGVLEGRISHLTQIDHNGKYEVCIALPHGLQTSGKSVLPAKAQWKGKVTILTSDKRLLLRLFEQLTDLLQ